MKPRINRKEHPRYPAIEVAKQRAKIHQCPVVLGSATPSLESFARAQKGVYQLLTLFKNERLKLQLYRGLNSLI